MTFLQLDGIGRTYPEQPPVIALAEVSLAVRRGEFIAIQGPSGSGKSSLLNVIALLDQPSSGRYSVDGIDTCALSERSRAALRSRTFGFVFQSFHLISQRSALENVELGLLYHGIKYDNRRELALEALARVGMEHRSEHVASKLSGGERQRVAIARAVVGGAEVIVADEPTGNLDTATSHSIVTQLTALHEDGSTVVLVTHDADVAAAARRRIQVRDGRVVGDTSLQHPLSGP